MLIREEGPDCGGIVKTAIVMHYLGVGREEADEKLAMHGGVIRRVLERAPPPVPHP